MPIGGTNPWHTGHYRMTDGCRWRSSENRWVNCSAVHSTSCLAPVGWARRRLVRSSSYCIEPPMTRRRLRHSVCPNWSRCLPQPPATRRSRTVRPSDDIRGSMGRMVSNGSTISRRPPAAGRVAPSLQALPTVIWETPLREYASEHVMDIRQMRTHGEKRVRVVMEVFFAIDRLLRPVQAETHLAFSLVPAFVPLLESFISRSVAESHEVSLSGTAGASDSTYPEPKFRLIPET